MSINPLLSVACPTIYAQEVSETEPLPVPDLSRPHLVLDTRHLDDSRIEDENCLALQVEGAAAGSDQIAAPVGVVTVRQRDGEASFDRLGNERRQVRTIALSTHVVKDCVGTLETPSPAEREGVNHMLREPTEEPAQPSG